MLQQDRRTNPLDQGIQRIEGGWRERHGRANVGSTDTRNTQVTRVDLDGQSRALLAPHLYGEGGAQSRPERQVLCLGGVFDVLRVVIHAAANQHVLDATDDEQFAKAVTLGIPVIYEWELFRFLDQR